MTDPDTARIRKRRGVVKASITRLAKNHRELAGKADEPNTLNLAQRMVKRLETLDLQFKEYHGALIDLIKDDEEAALQREQDVLDEHDDEISLLTVEVQQLVLLPLIQMLARSSSEDSPTCKRPCPQSRKQSVACLMGLTISVFSVIMRNNSLTSRRNFRTCAPTS